MANKNNQSRSSQLARAYLLSFPQLMVWALIFASVGGLVVWRGMAARAPQGTCAYSNQTVTATGLPNDTVINFFVTDTNSGNKTGWVLGITHDGTWRANVPAPTGPTTYDFTSKTWGKDGSKFSIYAECYTSA